jgi:hypothetical protein
MVCGPHQASYSVVLADPFPWNKMAEAWSWLPHCSADVDSGYVYSTTAHPFVFLRYTKAASPCVCLSVYLSVCLSVCPSVRPSVYVTIIPDKAPGVLSSSWHYTKHDGIPILCNTVILFTDFHGRKWVWRISGIWLYIPLVFGPTLPTFDKIIVFYETVSFSWESQIIYWLCRASSFSLRNIRRTLRGHRTVETYE